MIGKADDDEEDSQNYEPHHLYARGQCQHRVVVVVDPKISKFRAMAKTYGFLPMVSTVATVTQ